MSATISFAKSYSTKHRKALIELYESAGVGVTYKQRHAYWNSIKPGVYISHFAEDDHIHRTRAFEFVWLIEKFPEDFTPNKPL